MFYFKIVIRLISATVISLAIIALLFSQLNNSIGDAATALWVDAILFVQIPLTILLLLVSTYTYLTQRSFWLPFETEYYFVFASLAPIIIICLFVVAIP